MDLLFFSSRTAPLPLCQSPCIVVFFIYAKNMSIKHMTPVGEGVMALLRANAHTYTSTHTYTDIHTHMHSFLLSPLRRPPQLYESGNSRTGPNGFRHCKKADQHRL